MVIDEEMTVHIVAASASKPGDYVVEDETGERRLFIGSTGSLSRRRLNPDFLAALLRGPQWEEVSEHRWYSLEDLRARAASLTGDPASGIRRFASAFGGR